jgi:hypothetical protein
MEGLIAQLGERFGVLAESNTSQLTVICHNTDVAVGDLFLLPSTRGLDRMYVFRTTQYANILNRGIDINELAKNKLTMPDAYMSENLAEERLIELRGMVLGYAERKAIKRTGLEQDGLETGDLETGESEWHFHRPRRSGHAHAPAQSTRRRIVHWAFAGGRKRLDRRARLLATECALASHRHFWSDWGGQKQPDDGDPAQRPRAQPTCA